MKSQSSALERSTGCGPQEPLRPSRATSVRPRIRTRIVRAAHEEMASSPASVSFSATTRRPARRTRSFRVREIGENPASSKLAELARSLPRRGSSRRLEPLAVFPLTTTRTRSPRERIESWRGVRIRNFVFAAARSAGFAEASAACAVAVSARAAAAAKATLRLIAAERSQRSRAGDRRRSARAPPPG